MLVTKNDRQAHVVRFDSSEEFIEATKAVGVHNHGAGGAWSNDESFKESLEFARHGNDSLVSESEKIIESLDSVENGVQQEYWAPSVCGAYPIVPEYLAGHPMCMRSKEPSGDLAPVNIYVCTTSSGSIGSEEYMQRGTAILALVMKLQQIRPVNLFVTFECDGGYKDHLDAVQIIPIESRPLNISQACYMLTSTGFSRNLTYSYGEHVQGWAGGWISDHDHRPGGTPKYRAKIKEYLGLGPDDLHLDMISSIDPMLRNPIAWVNTELARYNGAAE